MANHYAAKLVCLALTGLLLGAPAGFRAGALAFPSKAAPGSSAPGVKPAAQRSGTVRSAIPTKVWVYMELEEAGGKTFWVAFNRCDVKPGDTVRVISGTQYTAIESTVLQRRLEDFIGAAVIELNGKVLKAPSAHELPPGHPSK